MDLRTNTYKSVNVFTDKVLLNIHVDKERRYALKKRALKRWIYLHGYLNERLRKSYTCQQKNSKESWLKKKFLMWNKFVVWYI